MTTVALCVAPGTVDRDFTRRLARYLGLELVDLRPFERKLARHFNTDSSIVKRFINSRSRVQVPISRQQLARRIQGETLELAARDGVLIVAWSAPYILRGFSHIARVAIDAGMSFRERNIMAALSFVHARTARLEIESEDGMLARYMALTFGTDWRDPGLFDLIVDADAMTPRLCIDALAKLIEAPRFRQTPEARFIISAYIADLLSEEERTGRQPFHARDVVSVDRNSVSLSGIESHEDAIARIEQFMHGVGSLRGRSTFTGSPGCEPSA